jgi:hypothetical protein
VVLSGLGDTTNILSGCGSGCKSPETRRSV